MSTSVFFYEPFHAFDRPLDHGFSLRDDGAVRSLRYHPHHISSRCSQQDGPLQTNTVTVTLELPGLEKEDVSIETQDGRLMASAESRPRADSEDAGSYAARQRRFGKIARTLQMPQGVNARFISAASIITVMLIYVVGRGYPGVNGKRSSDGHAPQDSARVGPKITIA
jgi:HSP20 family protein